MKRSAAVLRFANFLDRDTKIQALAAASEKSVVQAGNEGNPEATAGLKVLKHGDGAEFAYNMYKEYVSDANFQYFPDFMQKLDTMLFEFRGNQPLELADDDDDDDDDDDSGFKKGRGKRGKKSRYKPMKKRPKAVRAIPTPESGGDEPEPEESAVVSATGAALDRLYNFRRG